MGQDYALQDLYTFLAQSSQECTVALTDETELELVQDVAGDLEVFMQLAKIGHYDRAMPYFNEYLTQHSVLFPVAAEYADALLEQGAFGQADDFLSGVIKSDTVSGMERTIVELLSAIARLHTSLELDHACEVAENAFRELRFRPARPLSDEQVCVNHT
jgi:thioredoxin-like negative regulator of GroEL